MKIQKVVWLGKNDEKDEQLENEEFRKKNILLVVVRRLRSQKIKNVEKKKGVNVGGEKGEQLQIEAR